MRHRWHRVVAIRASALVLSFLTGWILVISLLTGCSPASDKPLIVGMELSYPPFEMTDAQGRPAGVSVDLADALAKSLGKELVVQNIPFDGLIPALKTGKIDLIISSMTATAERAKSIGFSEPYLKTGLCLLVRKDSEVQSATDLDRAGRIIAVKQATTGHNYASQHLKNAKVLVLDREDVCVLEVVQGKADAFIYDQMSIFKHWQRNQEITRAILQPFQQESWAVGVRQGNDELLAKVNTFLNDFRAKGRFDQLGDKYLKEQKEAFQKLGYPFYF